MFEHGLRFPTSVVNSVTFPLDKVFTSPLSATMIQNTFNFIFVLSLNNECRWFVKDRVGVKGIIDV